MSIPQCKHIRIRGEDGYEINLDTLVKSIELQFKTDFTSLPNWKQLLKEIGNKQQYYETSIRKAIRRKFSIIDKLRVQNFRPSPFSLTNNLVRTAHLWKEIEMTNKKPKRLKSYVTFSPEETSEVMGERSEINLTPHPNSEIFQSDELVGPTLQEQIVEVETKPSLNHLPVFISTNQHKILSPLESIHSGFNINVKVCPAINLLPDSRNKDWSLFNLTTNIISKPSRIEIDNSILKKQIVTFFLTNSSTEALYVQFKTISDLFPFKKNTVHPDTPVKLYPGLTASFKFQYKLLPNQNIVNVIFLYFLVGRNVISGAANELFRVPVCSNMLDINKIITVTKTVNILPVYSWQINANSKFPTGNLKITVANAHFYYVRIKKHTVDFVDMLNDDTSSVNIAGVNTESVIKRMEDDSFDVENTLLDQSKKEIQIVDVEDSISITRIVSFLVEDILDLAMDVFIFEKTFVWLQPYSKCTIPVLFSKAEYEGYHQCCYDLDFYDPDTESLVTSKSIKVFAEVLPHPIQIQPKILDMTESPINFGFREDRIMVTNNHRIYPVTLKIKMTKKMKRLFQISPEKMTVSYYSSAYFLVKSCSKHFNNENKTGDLVHFTIKITLTGHEAVYRNVPPIFYEIIIPCTSEFKKVYSYSSII